MTGGHAELWILGAGGHGRVVADAAREAGRWREIVFFDDAWAAGVTVNGWRVGGASDNFFGPAEPGVQRIVAIGDNRLRQAALARCTSDSLALVVHPAATVSRDAELGAGSFVGAGAVVCIGARIGPGAIINTGAGVDHDCCLGACVHISPGARLGGGVSVGDRSWIGIGATVKHQMHIGPDAMVGAGAVVVAPVADNATVVGNPARPLTAPIHA